MEAEPKPIERRQFQAQQLMTEHQPVLRNRNKQIVFEIACPPGSAHGGTIEYSRWEAMPLPAAVHVSASASRVVARPGFYDYAVLPDTRDAVEWHVNFADPHLFVAYASALFAQDEMQVAEHPALGPLREALCATGPDPLTVENGAPTPVLVMGVERRCSVATDANPAEGRPLGLYGNAFARAPEEVVRRATRRIDPPTVTNLLAMAAPAGGYGPYRSREVEYVLTTAFTGFRAAVLESGRARGSACPVAVHTGFWGCGAFGGHRVLMAMLQVLAAQVAGLDRLVFHTGDRAGAEALETARSLLKGPLAAGAATPTGRLVEQIVSLRFKWGVSDGN